MDRGSGISELLNRECRGFRGDLQIPSSLANQGIQNQLSKKKSLKPPLVIFILGAEGMSQATTNSIKECYH